MTSVAIIITHFGRWPQWINFFIESCKWNHDIHWKIVTDCGTPENTAPNVHIHRTEFADYVRLASRTLNIDFRSSDHYKVCDLRPAFGVLHYDLIRDYDFWGFGDLDVIYGRIRAFYTEEVFARFNVLSTHPERVSGHFALFRNNVLMRHAFRRIAGFRCLLEDPNHLSVDEDLFTRVFRAGQPSHGGLRAAMAWMNDYHRSNLFIEQGVRSS